MRTLIRMSLASALLLGAITSAHAIPILRLTTSGGSTEIEDGSALDVNAAAGAVTFVNGLDAGWIVNVTTGLSKPLLGSAGAPELDLNSVNVSSSGPSWLEIELTDTGFTAQTAAQFLSAIGGTTSGSVSFTSYFDASNTEFGKATELASFTGLGAPAFSSAVGSYLTSPTPYSLTLLVRIAHDGPAASSFDATVKIPEPGTLFLLGAGLLALAPLQRRRASQRAEAA